MSIANEIQRIISGKNDIKQYAFNEFGIVIPDSVTIDNYKYYLENSDYLTFYCDEAGTIGWKCGDASIARTIQYSKDFGFTWNNLTSTASSATFSVSAGDVVWFKGTSSDYMLNSFTLSNKTHVYGNVNSLTGNNTSVGANCFMGLFSGCSNLYTYVHKKIILPATTLEECCYQDMFYGCTSLTTAPELPALTMASRCYSSMFGGCTSLTAAPVLPATTLATSCYQYMFYGCTSLSAAPTLPATALTGNCYFSMFGRCTSLTIAPVLPATTLASHCYEDMFKNCSSLNYIKALFTTTPSSSYTNNWVSGVASTGTFVKSVDATWDVTGNNGVPTGWTVVTE